MLIESPVKFKSLPGHSSLIMTEQHAAFQQPTSE